MDGKENNHPFLGGNMDNVVAKKSLGQNFLHDKNIIEKIVTSSSITDKDLIIEIGPGKGALTKELKRYNSEIICYEIDERMRPILGELENNRVSIIYGDFLKRDIKKDLEHKTYENLYVIGNLPYYITTPIIEKVIDSGIYLTAMTIMVQKEVADRFTANPKSKQYNSLTIYLNYYFDIEKVCLVKNTCFNPIPKVDSAVVKFTKKKTTYDVKNEEYFFKLVNDSFKFKRKTLKNNLNGYNWNIIKEVLFEKNFSESVRAEEIDIDTFVLISNRLND